MCREQCDNCASSQVMPQEDKIPALECRNKSSERFDSWVSGMDACRLFEPRDNAKCHTEDVKRRLGKSYETEEGPVRVHECPHCCYEWLEWCDADEYPYYCPSCGKILA